MSKELFKKEILSKENTSAYKTIDNIKIRPLLPSKEVVNKNQKFEEEDLSLTRKLDFVLEKR